jgi:heterodisulfide reductase subunit B2
VQRKRVVNPDERIPRIPEAVFLYRSCTGSLEYPGTESAVRETLNHFGIEAVTNPDQTCCSGFLQACSAYKPEFCLAVTARNLAIIERTGLETYTFCNGCYTGLSEFSHILMSQPDQLLAANDLIARWGYRYAGPTSIYHVQELWYRLKERIAASVVRPLKGLRVAAHYGCHYLSSQYGILDDGAYPTFHEELIGALGATPVFYKERQLCCGYSVGKGFTHKEAIVQPHLHKKLKSAAVSGVQLMTTVCPGCNVALDREQPNLNKLYGEDFHIPVIDLSQLIALALGLPVSKLGFAANTTSLDPILKRFNFHKGS